jgi:hypothetical protein
MLVKVEDMSIQSHEYCYLCGIQLCSHSVHAGEIPPPNHKTRDHVPPTGLFPTPRPDNLITVPCCFSCNNQHSEFDERLRIIASTPFDRNTAGEAILNEKVLHGTLKKGRQMQFVKNLLTSMQPVAGDHHLVYLPIDARDFKLGMIRITKGLLHALHPRFDYRNSKFDAIDIQPNPSREQLQLMAMLKQSQYFERGQKTFQCWRHVDEVNTGGAWMLVFYECFGFFVFHTNEPESTCNVPHPKT